MSVSGQCAIFTDLSLQVREMRVIDPMFLSQSFSAYMSWVSVSLNMYVLGHVVFVCLSLAQLVSLCVPRHVSAGMCLCALVSLFLQACFSVC